MKRNGRFEDIELRSSNLQLWSENRQHNDI